MLACLIEFGVVPGKEEQNQALVKDLLVEAGTIDGFISKESFTSRDTPGKVITLSYWKDADSLRAWMRNAEHRKAIPLGKKELFTHYTIQIADITSERTWIKPEEAV